MSRRRYWVFVAPGNEEVDLPSSCRSQWVTGRYAYLPVAHWEIMIEFVSQHFPQSANLFRRASCLDDDFSGWTMEKVRDFRHVLEDLSNLLQKSQDIDYKIYYRDYKSLGQEIPEHDLLDSEGYIEMIKLVMVVVDESLNLGEFFDSYVD
jgi:hypothetical protein